MGSPAQNDEAVMFWPLADLAAAGRPARAILPDRVSRHFVTLLDLWLAGSRQAQGLPTPGDLDVLIVAERDPRIVPHLWVLDVEYDPPGLRLRLMGGALTDGGAKAKVGDMLTAGQGDRETFDRLWQAGQMPAVHYRAGPPRLEHHSAVSGLEVLCLPLRCGPADRTDRLLNCTVYRWQEGYRGG